MAADDGKTNNTIIERFFSLKSFIEELSDSPNNHDDNVKRFNEMLNSLPRDQINIYTTDSQRNTLLHIALEEDVEWAAETLLEAGASVSEKDFLGCQPLHTACKTGDHSLVRLLLNHNADIQAEDNYGWSPLHYASYSGDESSVELLLKLGAKPLVLSMYGKTPFHLAVEGGYTEMVKMFLDKNMLFRVNVNARGVQKKTALHHAASSGHEEVIKALIDKGAKIGLKDTAGNTPLMTATRMGKLGSMNTLLALCGYNQANISDNTGKTPLLVAIEDENLGPLDILLKYWPDENKRNPAVYQKLLSYKGLTPTEGILKMQKSILDALENDQEAFDEALFWAATKFERHEIAKELLTRNLYLETNQFSAIELATQQQKPDVLWFLIATSPSTHKITESIKSAKAKAEETDAGGYQTDVMKHIIDILEDPPIAQLYKDDDISGPPRLRFEHSGPVKEFKALIARFYKANHVSGTIRKTRNVKNTVYGKGPTKIMTGAMSNLKNIMGGSFDNKDDDAKSSQLRATYGKDNLRFTYIHLPATNVCIPKDPSYLL
ncbi:Ankyrin-1 [Daldinia childiae]|uniref:Ankyrin-1 n=1 Tax=Daldinia childiae TaxID=326645 RepID=UPI001445DCF5|nr:Ankyrin-1 [Daldinia childiae]KAF3066566.1 Ankyrin-1 [Daldinia childiae]